MYTNYIIIIKQIKIFKIKSETKLVHNFIIMPYWKPWKHSDIKFRDYEILWNYNNSSVRFNTWNFSFINFIIFFILFYLFVLFNLSTPYNKRKTPEERERKREKIFFSFFSQTTINLKFLPRSLFIAAYKVSTAHFLQHVPLFFGIWVCVHSPTSVYTLGKFVLHWKKKRKLQVIKIITLSRHQWYYFHIEFKNLNKLLKT